MRLTYRPETPDDESFLRMLIFETLAAQLETQYQVQRQGFRGSSDTSIIVLDGEIPVGWYVTAESADAIRLLNIVVQTRHRGQGVGSAVLSKLLAAADAAEKSLRLSVVTHNERALRLYKRLGFQCIGGDEVQRFLEYPPRGRNV